MATAEQLYKQLIDELKEKYRNFEISKKEIILKVKDLLVKNGYTKNLISSRLTADLKNIASADYIREVLGPEFIQDKFITEKNKVKKAILVTNEGRGGGDSSQQEEEEEEERPPSIPTGETNAEKNRRITDEYFKHKYEKLAGKQSSKLQRADKKEESRVYSGPSITQKIEEEAEKTYFISINDTDILDKIVALRTQQNIMRIKLEVDASDNSVINVKT